MERPPYEIALMHDHILRLEEETKQLKAENEELRDTLKKIKEILKLYAGSQIGDRQNDGTYRMYLHPKHHAYMGHYEPCYYVYDPKPAKYGVKILEKYEE